MTMIRYGRCVQGFITGFVDGMRLHPVLRESRAPQAHEPGVKMTEPLGTTCLKTDGIRYFTKDQHDARS
jgi:hypothetical protein